MFATFGRSWQLAKASLSVLRSDKELLLFPIQADTIAAAFRSKTSAPPPVPGPGQSF